MWDALTRPERLTEWFGHGDIGLDLVQRGKFEVRTTGPPELVEAIIREAGRRTHRDGAQRCVLKPSTTPAQRSGSLLYGA